MSEVTADKVTEEAEESSTAVVEALPAEEPAPDPHELGLELPDDKDEAIALLLRELKEARDEGTAYLDDLKRVAADFDNYRKRALREQAATLERAVEKVVRELLPTLDTFDASLGFEPKTDGERQLYSGMINTREQLLKALEAHGLEVIPTIGERFDPKLHEPAGAPEGRGELVVTEELRRGYRINGKVLRPALVALKVEE
ncbi:MAG: nucleotide exchange factor GrpE [Acidimicrobiia bacterium]